MNRKIFAALLVLAATVSSVQYVFGWGAWGHNHINKGAVMALPAGMGMFFYNHADFIVEESTVPDLRKYTMGDKEEYPRHYIDLEQYSYSTGGRPATLKDAVARYSKDSTDKYGTLPWYIKEMMEKLTVAFKNKRKTEILLLAADLGHYVGDAHMPLHTTVNHNGQLTGQVGIHAFWESQLPELFGRNYKLYTGEAEYIADVEKATWATIDSSHKLIDRLLRMEAKLRKDNPADKQYVMGNDGQPLKNKFGQPVHAYEYAHVYHELLGGMVENQLRAATKMTADLWYTAWVNAGKPDLSELDPEYITDRNKPFYAQDLKYFRNGKIKGCSSDKEFPR